MIKRDYYKLKQAAEILDCSEDDLIHYGARNKIKICVLRGDYDVVSQRVDLFDEQPIDDEHYQFDNEPLQLSQTSLIWLEEGSENAFAYIPTKTIWTENHGRPLEAIKYRLKHRRHNETPKVQDLIMVIMADELERFQNQIVENHSQTKEKITKNQRRNDVFREFNEKYPDYFNSGDKCKEQLKTDLTAFSGCNSLFQSGFGNWWKSVDKNIYSLKAGRPTK